MILISAFAESTCVTKFSNLISFSQTNFRFKNLDVRQYSFLFLSFSFFLFKGYFNLRRGLSRGKKNTSIIVDNKSWIIYVNLKDRR